MYQPTSNNISDVNIKKCKNCPNSSTDHIRAKPSNAPPVIDSYEHFCSWNCLVRYASSTSAKTWKENFDNEIKKKSKSKVGSKKNVNEDENNVEEEEQPPPPPAKSKTNKRQARKK
ncbi:hypothetical protein DLAC_00980 [Tieghemostelium lacteum]|uniref:MYM-type domain-containing protein n=1 Tax=Tieghemostelium lacteum TaxID=361077 RepID=A0A152A7I2_TIELA|nr:hypothetical protein DLAC_00980 [Tieghemostelium lacteum]|eukprot:KYR02168.1 hypothetical protein DLAC_00980 [Tieghemostelium lacteum]